MPDGARKVGEVQERDIPIAGFEVCSSIRSAYSGSRLLT